MNNRILKLVVLTGNIFCVYRNYCSISFVRRCIVWARVFLELALIVICIITNSGYYHKFKSQLTYLFLTLISSFCILLLAWFHCKSFECLTHLIEENHAYFVKDKKYCTNLVRKYNFAIAVMIVYPLLSISLLYNYVFTSLGSESKYVAYSLYAFICNIRYMFEYITISCILYTLSEHLNCMIRKISKERPVILIECEQMRFPSNRSTASSARDDLQELTSFEVWTKYYMNIQECSRLVNTIFGVEITIILATLIFYLIIFLYSIAYITVNGTGISLDLFSYIIKTFIFMVALFMLSRSAQAVQNSVDRLKRYLGRLLIHSTENLVRYKEIKDLLRLVSSRPIQTRALGSIDIDMSLLPKFVMFFTSYTVIALQFNNVV